MQRHRGQMPSWLLFSALAIGVIGASVLKHAEGVSELVSALGSRTDGSITAVSVGLRHCGLVLLVAGAVAMLAGLVIAFTDRRMRQRCAMDPRGCSTACHDLRSAPPCPHGQQLRSTAVATR